MKSLKLIVAALVMATAFLVAGSIALAQSSAPATGNIAVRDGINPGEVVVPWDAVPGATHYRIGYVNMVTDYPLAKASVTGDWINAFIYVDENARNVPVANGRAEYTVRRLQQDARHAFTVLTSNNFVDTGAAGSVTSEFSWPSNPRWTFHTVADRGGATGPTPGFDFVSMYPNCDAVRAHYPGGVRRGSPIYRPALDSDGDGIACESTDDVTSEEADDGIDNSSTSASATVELQLTIGNMPINAESGSSIELYLEDDFQVPNFIPQDSVYFTASNPFTADTNNGGSVVAAGVVEIREGDHFRGGDDWAIRVFIPDMTANLDGYQGPLRGQTVTLTFTGAAGIRNPSEEGTHSVGYSILGPDDAANGGPQGQLGTVPTYAKISLSDMDNTRGYELTVTGTGFNNGTSAAVHVLSVAEGAAAPTCAEVIRRGSRVGIAIVGSDDGVSITFEVTVPTFVPGKNNYICMVDGEGRYSTNVEQFHLEPAMRVVPGAAYAGDTVVVFVQDFPNPGAALTSLKIAGREVFKAPAGCNPCLNVNATVIAADGSATATFDMPGSISGVPLVGTVRIDAKWGDVSADGKITVTGSALSASQREVRPNDSLTILGERFSGSSVIYPENITMDGVPLLVDNDSLTNGVVEVSNTGQFTATVYVWPASDNSFNPTLISGTHTIQVWDSQGFFGTATVVIKDPGITVSPAVLGPLDYLTITGTDWPVNNPDSDADIEVVEIQVDDHRYTRYTATSDASGRFTVEHRVSHDVAVPSTQLVRATYDSEIVRVASFEVQ